MPRAAGPYLITSVQQHTLTIDENGDPFTILIDLETTAPSNNMNACRGNDRYAIKGEEAIIENKHKAPKGEVAEN